MRKFVFFLSALAVVLSSCSRKDEAIALSKAFFMTLSDTTYACPRDYYPLYDSLHVKAKSDLVEINESDIQEYNDTFIVRCYNNYTSSNGIFKQDSVKIFITTNNADQLYIYDSHGLVVIDEDMKEFGNAIGAYKDISINDLELASRIKNVNKIFLKEYLNTHLDLMLNVKIQDWSWETSYSGEAHGEGRVINELDYSIEGLKYELTYYDYNGNFMAKDDGNISKKLLPGEKYNFTFWSSNAKNPRRAKMKLVFPDKLIFDIIKKKTYTGNEYTEYIKDLDSEKNEKTI